MRHSSINTRCTNRLIHDGIQQRDYHTWSTIARQLIQVFSEALKNHHGVLKVRRTPSEEESQTVSYMIDRQSKCTRVVRYITWGKTDESPWMITISDLKLNQQMYDENHSVKICIFVRKIPHCSAIIYRTKMNPDTPALQLSTVNECWTKTWSRIDDRSKLPGHWYVQDLVREAKNKWSCVTTNRNV